jgi:hypothetical protein
MKGERPLGDDSRDIDFRKELIFSTGSGRRIGEFKPRRTRVLSIRQVCRLQVVH